MKINQAGIDLIKSFESCCLTAYPDPATKSDPYTIGFGHTGSVVKGSSITHQEAEALLKQDLERFERGVDDLLDVELNSNQFSALVSFSFNCGLNNLKNSTLLKLINNDKLDLASKQFLVWNKANGQVMAGLTKRRQSELSLFNKDTI